MNLDKYLKRTEIDKVIDPGENSGVSLSIPITTLDVREVPNTSVSVLVNDLTAHTTQTQLVIQAAIDDIVATNISDTGFGQYVEMIKANFYNPSQLISNPTAKPAAVYSAAQIKAAERDVYRRVIDPRAPFIQDLFNMQAEAGLIQYSLVKVWNKLIISNGLFDKFDDASRLAKLSLFKDQQHLNEIAIQSQNIQKNIGGKIANNLIWALSQRIISQLNVAPPGEVLKQLTQIETTLKQIKTLLSIAIILNNSNWESFASDIKDIFGDFSTYTYNKIATTQIYSIIGGIESNVSNFAGDINKFLPFGLELRDIPEIQELQNQLNLVFLKSFGKVEDDMIRKEGESAKLQEARSLRLANSQKNRKTKEFITLINQIIDALEETKLELQNFTSLLQMDVNKFGQTLQTRLSSFSTTVATSPTNYKPDLYPSGQEFA